MWLSAGLGLLFALIAGWLGAEERLPSRRWGALIIGGAALGLVFLVENSTLWLRTDHLPDRSILFAATPLFKCLGALCSHFLARAIGTRNAYWFHVGF